jgi:hypothetical protein
MVTAVRAGTGDVGWLRMLVGFVGFVGSYDLQVGGLAALGNGRDSRDEVDGVSAFEHVWEVALSQSADFVSGGCYPLSACGAVSELGVFFSFACVWVNGRICRVEPSLVDGSGCLLGVFKGGTSCGINLGLGKALVDVAVR